MVAAACIGANRTQAARAAVGPLPTVETEPLLDEAHPLHATLCVECRAIRSVASFGRLLAEARGADAR